MESVSSPPPPSAGSPGGVPGGSPSGGAEGVPDGIPGGFPLPLLVVMRLAGAFRKVFVEEMAQEDWVVGVDTGPPMYGVLRAATYLDGPSQRDVATSIGLDPSDLVGVLDRMEANGWVVRERDPADRRRSRVRTTDEGRVVLERYNAVARRAGERIMSGLDDAERDQFSALALRMLQASGEDVTRLSRAAHLA